MAATRESVFPSLVVFDLDECVWKPEMYTLTKVPTVKDAVRGQLPGGVGEGVVGVRSGRETISIFPGAMHVSSLVAVAKSKPPKDLYLTVPRELHERRPSRACFRASTVAR